MPLELLTIGRISVDLYAEQLGVPLREVRTFRKSIGGTATNVAVAAARLGHRAAVFTKVGDDPFGDYVRWALAETRSASTPASSATDPVLRTPLAFAELDPPDDPRIIFYREPKAPDLNLELGDVDGDVVGDRARAVGPGRRAVRRAQPLARSTTCWSAGGPARRTPCSTSTGGRSSGTRPASATREVDRALDQATMAIGNRAECEIAVGTADPRRGGRPRCWPAGCRRRSSSWAATACWWPPPTAGGSRCRRTRSRWCAGWAPATPSAARSATGCCRAGTSCECARYGNAAGAIVAGRLMCADDMPTFGEIEDLSGSAMLWTMTGGRELLEQRADQPEAALERLRSRPRRPLLTDGRLFIVAADHTARGMLGVGGDPFAMADRRRSSSACSSSLAHPGRRRRARQPRRPRGAGAARRARRQAGLRHDEPRRAHGCALGARRPDDGLRRRTASPHGGLDGGKVLLRIADDDAGTAPTLEACAQAVSRARPPGPADHGRAAAVPRRPRTARPSCSTTTTSCCGPSRWPPASGRRRPTPG